MAVATKNCSGAPLSDPGRRRPAGHVSILKYDGFLRYLVDELERATEREIRLCDEALIECLVKHRELTNGPYVWSPLARSYLPFQEARHGHFSALVPKGPCVVKYIDALLPLYCKLCFAADCHDRAGSTARSLLSRLQRVASCPPDPTLAYELRAAEYLIDNLSASPPREWGDVARSPDVSVDTKVAVELLWSHLVLVYSGNRRLLLCNVERFFTTPQNSFALCPVELRAALFAHGRHDPISKRHDRYRREHVSRRTTCPVSPRQTEHHRKRSRQHTLNNSLHESRLSRLCWLGALWLLDFECNETFCRWLRKPEPYRAQSERSGSDPRGTL